MVVLRIYMVVKAPATKGSMLVGGLHLGGNYIWHNDGKPGGCARLAWDCFTILLLDTFFGGNVAPLSYTCNGPTPGNGAGIFVCPMHVVMM